MSFSPALFLDWLAAREVSLSAASVTAFLADVDAAPSTVAGLVRWLRGQLGEGTGHAVHRQSAAREGKGWLTVDEALSRIAVTGAAGVTGRRDALIVSLVEAGATKAQVAGMRTSDVHPPDLVGAVQLTKGRHPGHLSPVHPGQMAHGRRVPAASRVTVARP